LIKHLNKTIAVISLGCDKNRVDTERMLFALSSGGFMLTTEDEAQIIIINTCAFIESARKEAIETILTAAEHKKRRLEKLIVTGCLPQKYLDEIKGELPEVDAFLGVAEYDNILSVIERLYEGERVFDNAATDETEPKGRVLTTAAYAYLKIAEGCDNHCTYCTIPSIRGRYRSRSIESLTVEAQNLAQRGIKELVLVAQDVTRYGADLYGKPSLAPLLQGLSATDIRHIRLLYCYPELVSDELIREIAANDKVVKYIDIPLQHISDRVLRLMGRRGNSDDIKRLINRLRREIEGIIIRTTFMVGFPGETEEDFEKLLAFVREYKLNHAGFFVYSLEKDTPSAKLPDRVDKKTANYRLKALAAAQREVAVEYNRSYVGKVFNVLYEGIDYNKRLFYGITYMSAPDVDPLVYFKADDVDVGNVYRVEITEWKGYDLIGKVGFE